MVLLANMNAQGILRKPAHHMCDPKWTGFFDLFQICLGLSLTWDSVGLQKSAVNLSPARSHGPHIAHSLMPHPSFAWPVSDCSKMLKECLFFSFLLLFSHWYAVLFPEVVDSLGGVDDPRETEREKQKEKNEKE